MNTVAIVSTTGGAGRSTLTAELASLLAQRKHPALALECDPANVLGFHFGMREIPEDGLGAYLDAPTPGAWARAGQRSDDDVLFVPWGSGGAPAALANAAPDWLGRLLAPMGVRYVMVPLQRAPAPYASERFDVPASLRSALDQQLDLEKVDVNDGILVYRNRAWAPTRAQIGAGTPVGRTFLAAASVDLSLSANVLPDDQGTAGATGAIEAPGRVLVGEVPALGRNVRFRVARIAPQGEFATQRATRATRGYDVHAIEVRLRPAEAVAGLRPGMSVLFAWPQ